MQDNANIEKKQAEALSAAIDALNRGVTPDASQEAELEELLLTAKLVKNAAQAPAEPPRAVLNSIVNQAANTIAQEKRKKRLAWGFAGLSGAVAAVLLVALLNVVPPVSPEQELAKSQQLAPPPPAEVTPPATIAKPSPDLLPPPASPAKQEATPKAITPETEAIKQPTATEQLPSVGLAPSPSSVPASSDTMLALAERKADVVTIDAVSKVIRQVYHQGAPDEIIITQAPKRQSTLRIAPKPSEAQVKMAAPVPNESVEIKPPNRNKVTITVDNSEVTLEGAATEQELLNLSKTLTKVSVAK
ncbi:hypothetical protein [Sporomusa malonica]|uniref:Uncharacterized protein n=1 Tax=Sporomusa malonica TaxID=112901 RepID=A0A1W1YPD3_9FIRM|nr:hypothetical protein [Sporomusa malonica]SMC38055.1 hypothetical protein SAMN04488500_10251 [Sporomusa malonica]